MTALAGVELESLVSEPDALTTRPPPCATVNLNQINVLSKLSGKFCEKMKDRQPSAFGNKKSIKLHFLTVFHTFLAAA